MGRSILSIGQEIRRLRRARGFTAGQTAQRAGVGRTTLSALENGHGNVELTSLLAICEALGVEIAFIAQEVADLAHHDAQTALTATQTRIQYLMGSGKPVDRTGRGR
jgi:transcriptional regulator with XRE-family HTH domain